MGYDSTKFSIDSEMNDVTINKKPKTSTLEIIRQFARVCTPVTSTVITTIIIN